MYGTAYQPTLQQGNSGLAVQQLQRRLKDLGFSLPKYGVDGKFGNETRKAVMDFQYTYFGIREEVDGIVGPRTWAALNEAYNMLARKEWNPNVDPSRAPSDWYQVTAPSRPPVVPAPTGSGSTVQYPPYEPGPYTDITIPTERKVTYVQKAGVFDISQIFGDIDMNWLIFGAVAFIAGMQILFPTGGRRDVSRKRSRTRRRKSTSRRKSRSRRRR